MKLAIRWDVPSGQTRWKVCTCWEVAFNFIRILQANNPYYTNVWLLIVENDYEN